MRTVVIGAGRMGRRHIQVVKELGFDLAGFAIQILKRGSGRKREAVILPCLSIALMTLKY